MKVLIISVSTGAGHVRAAEAVEAAFASHHPAVKALHVNAMNYVSKPFRKLYEDGYAFMVNQAPAVWSSVYGLTDRSVADSRPQRIINSVQSWNASALFECIDRFKPDRILTTHFFIPQILASRIQQGRFRIPVECVITDFDLHQSWVDPRVSHYYVAREKVAIKLARHGVAREKITVSGIPIHPNFLKEASRDAVLNNLGLRPERPTLLLLSGGLGFGAMETTVRRLFDLKHPAQIITVSGKNKEKLNRLNALRAPEHISLLNLGFVSNMHELLNGSDMVVTKAGGLTISECLARGAAILIHGAIPGQEEKNAAYVKLKGAGLEARSLDDLYRKIQSFLEIPSALQRFRHNARLCSKPFAAFTVADTLLQHMPS